MCSVEGAKPQGGKIKSFENLLSCSCNFLGSGW